MGLSDAFVLSASGRPLPILRRAPPAEVVAFARTWKDVPFRHQGRSREGIDCAGLVIVGARTLGLSRFDTTGYRAKPDGRSLRAYCDDQMVRVPVDRYGPGNVLLFRNVAGEPQHMGIVGDYAPGGHSLVHAYERNGKVVEARLDDVWRRLIVAAYALPGVG